MIWMLIPPITLWHLLPFNANAAAAANGNYFHTCHQSLQQPVRRPSSGIVPLGANLFQATIDLQRFELFSAPSTSGRQRSANWCWASCIKMVLNYYGIPINQRQIVEQIFGTTMDVPGGAREILTTLNNFFITLDGELVKPRAQLLDPTTTTTWLDLLATGRPLILCLSGHAYVVKSATFSVQQNSNAIIFSDVSGPLSDLPGGKSYQLARISCWQHGDVRRLLI